MDTASTTLTRYLEEHAEESLLRGLGSKDLLARSLFAPHLRLFASGQLPLPNPVLVEAEAAAQDKAEQRPLNVDRPDASPEAPATFADASCGGDAPLPGRASHPEVSQLTQLRRRLREQKLQMLAAGMRRCQSSAMKAWAAHALLARQRSKHQAKLSKLRAEAQKEVAQARAAQAAAEVEFRQRLRREFAKGWATASRRVQALALRAWAAQALLGRQRRVHQLRMASLRASPRVPERSVEGEAAPSQGSRSRPGDSGDSRRYPLHLLLRYREMQRLAGQAMRPPPGLGGREADVRLRGLRLPPGGPWKQAATGPGLEVAVVFGLLRAPPGLARPSCAGASGRRSQAS